MNIRRIYLLLFVALTVIALSFGAVFAQEATPEATAEATDDAGTGGDTGGLVPGELVSCDSDLILSLYIAERFFDFSSFNSQMSADTMLDLDSYDRGQYSSLFDDMDSSNAVVYSDETRSSISELMLMDDLAFELEMNTMGASETNLSEGFAEEAAECAALRSSLRRFFNALAMSDVSMADAGSLGTGMDSAGSSDSSTDTSGDTQEGVYVVTLSGAQEVPGPGDEDASGTATVYLRSATNEVCVDISIQNIALPATAAHIHQAPAGESGPPVVTLVTPNDAGLSNTCVTVDAALMQEMVVNPQNFYVNIHNAEFPDGAARGQLQ